MQQLEDAWQKGNAEIHSNLMGSAAISSPGHNRELVTDQTDGRASTLGWQDVKGNWSGSLRAYGGGGGASNVDFDIEGQDWQYPLDQRTYRLDEVSIANLYTGLQGPSAAMNMLLCKRAELAAVVICAFIGVETFWHVQALGTCHCICCSLYWAHGYVSKRCRL